ncbi:hypothetical protein [Streptosporangium sp. NPDC049376]|uniref:hypothetical protein n=1 Tax=Streptosporangium sp. NPDC049376 TaxID=3366192 RepID=UPI00379AB061
MKSLPVIVIVLAVAGCATAVLASRSAAGPPAAPPPCPQRWGGEAPGGWVPGPSGVAGAGGSLVPGDPVSALICAYPGDNTHPGGTRLAGSRSLTEGAVAMARDLDYLPAAGKTPLGPCTLMGGPMTNYLVRFVYDDGKVLWLGSAEEVNSCVTTTNGAVGSPSYIGPEITAAYESGTWRPVRPADPCQGRPTGRRGQNEQMVPEGAVSVLACGRPHRPDAPPVRREHDAETAESLTRALNSLGTRPGDNTCRRVSDLRERPFQLRFRYPDGPAAIVDVMPGCVPMVNNGLLQADADDTVRELTKAASPYAR